MNWREQIEAQIAWNNVIRYEGGEQWSAIMPASIAEALLDVAVEAEELHGEISDTGIVEWDTLDVLGDMLDKLRVMSEASSMGLVETIRKQQAEIERLQEQIDLKNQSLKMYEEDIRSLRDALERIEEGCSFPADSVQKAIVTVAREALRSESENKRGDYDDE